MKKIIYNAKNQIFIYNSINRKKEKFIPIKNNYINMYVCGPTLYNYIHLGNCRTFIFFDIVYRYFKHLNFNVKYVRNITDININNNNINDKNLNFQYFNYITIIQKYFLNFNKILKILNILSPNIEPKTTCHIIEQIENIKKIVKLNLAYKYNGSIYFDIEKYNKKNGNYGKILNNINIKNEFIIKNKFLNEKKNFFDFVIWKKNKNNNIIKWNSPWGEGIPGWHMGCTTLSNKFLGNYFDIHGGGSDLKFPHHECEISQSNVINNNNNNLAKYWLHTNMLTINNKKMSKSLNNFILPYDIINGKLKITNYKKINPIIIRLYIIQTHYRKVINLSKKSIENAKKNYISLLNFFKKVKKVKTKKKSSIDVNILCNECYNSLNDDFNIPLLIYNLFKINNFIDKCINKELQITFKDLEKLKKIMKIFIIDILGLKIIKKKKKLFKKKKIYFLIKSLLKIRNKMKKKKMYYFSDKIRKLLKNYISIIDK
ncbi:MAG: cysteine--tRNA ligase [Candidatus Shikimatogenerans bostrichidophilus]|nr:MAG: cysteine--tRNA ligase [Candidatus Shikimatogenerans bostrichidophilus]